MNDQTAKSDAGKPTYTLVPPAILDSIEAVRAYGNRQVPRPRKLAPGRATALLGGVSEAYAGLRGTTTSQRIRKAVCST